MARKKKIEEPVYVRTGICDGLATLAIKYDIDIETLRELNPHIHNPFMLILPGEKVRIK